jgi:hypothetical protein
MNMIFLFVNSVIVQVVVKLRRSCQNTPHELEMTKQVTLFIIVFLNANLVYNNTGRVPLFIRLNLSIKR